mmetsp:Transcript_55619/g.136296  ORF Transcript_55619/g.136296 Transcript_55619/m.136296 type:complete len:110 (+) Transcript_55619:25-354(+)
MASRDSTVSAAGKIKGILSDPANRGPVNLLARSTLAMFTIPLAVYFLSFHIVFAQGGLLDYSKDLNMRVNLSGVASIVAVQFVIAGHVIMAFRQDDEAFAREAAAAKRD